jgi:hypothetical protein
MKTTKPTHINYATQYQLMRLAETVMPLMPSAIIDKFSAVVTPRMMAAEENAHTLHTDRFDLIVDWGCLAHRVVRAKIAK